ncbi:MAG: DUF1553 domain-containing protein [Planctomycetota bacterium]
MRVRSLFAIALLTASSLAAEEPDSIQFSRDVRPILSEKCVFCHGPDEEHRESGLRLDRREDAMAVIDSGDFVDRITSDDEDVVMPPPHAKLPLTEDETSLLKRWVDQGAEYEQHWSFEWLPDEVTVPSPGNAAAWCRSPIDRFVIARLQSAGLQPSEPASPSRWLRRATLDLTGLPPTPEQLDAFETAVSATGDAAYEAAVDRLLGSHSFGEHMAVGWLDLARYADSYGYQSDKLNTQWAYRDWVVRAFNDNLPYDQFLTWQLAGDLLENPSEDQLLATAFNRIHRLNNEGGAVFEEWRIENVADRVHTFGTAVLGLTLECCRCHDHKYDPIPMRDYYALSAFFNSIDESGVYDRTAKVPCPSMLLPTEEQRKSLSSAESALAAAELAYEQERRSSEQRFNDWKAGIANDASHSIPDLTLALSFDREFNNQLKEIYHPSEGDRRWTTMPPLVEVERASLPRLTADEAADLLKEGPLPPRRALLLDGERGVTTHGIEPLDRWTPFSFVVTFRETKRSSERSLIAHHTRGTDCGYNGWDLTLVDGHVESRMYRVWPGNAIGVRTVEPIPVDRWHQLVASYDGSSKAKGLKLSLDGEPLETVILRDNVKKSCNVKVDHGGEFVIGQRFRARGLEGGLIDEVRLYERELTIEERRWLARDHSSEITKAYYDSAIDAPCRSKLAALTKARQEWVMAEEVTNEIPIMREMDEARPTHVLLRGEYDAPTSDETLVQRDVLSALPLQFPEGHARDRLGLARWATDRRHPLTSRVAVNHFWSRFFAEPLVRTPENFGLQGELPTHPELLDWLARNFVHHQWDVKRLCKQIVLSSTYRQDSVSRAELQESDPTNRLLARGPAHRLSAEQIRDAVLAASGLLDPTRGGPPVSPYQPGKDLWREANGMSPPYQQSVGESLHRRSLYSVWKRTVPLPNMMAFDSTTREVCTVKRSRTNTPMQALVLLNDVQFVEAARAMAARLLRADGTDEVLVTGAFRTLTGRRPETAERKLLLELLRSERAHFRNQPASARALIEIGDSEAPNDLPPAELAAATTLCQAIMNPDATIWKR